MTMPCSPRRDMNLVMLAHGELKGSEWVATRIHMTCCSTCRRRFAHFAAVSRVLKTGVLGMSTSWAHAALEDIDELAAKAALARRAILLVGLVGVLLLWLLTQVLRSQATIQPSQAPSPSPIAVTDKRPTLRTSAPVPVAGPCQTPAAAAPSAKAKTGSRRG